MTAIKNGGEHEAPIRASELMPLAILKLVEHHGHIGLWSINLKSGENRFSDGFFRIAGLTPATDGGDVLYNLVHPDDLRIREEIATLLAAGMPAHREFRIIRPDRTVRWLELKAEIILDAQARPERAEGLIWDITGRRETEQLILRSESRYQGLIKAIASVVWTATREGFTRSCPGWSEITGQTDAEWQNGGWITAVHPDDRRRVWHGWQDAVAGNTPYDEDYRLLCLDGHYRWFKSRGVPIFNDDRTVREWVGVMFDVSHTARHRMSSGEPTLKEITGPLVRSARAMLNWSIGDLAAAAGVSGSSIKRFEDSDGTALRERTRIAVRTSLEAAGIRFVAPKPGTVGILFDAKREPDAWTGDFDI